LRTSGLASSFTDGLMEVVVKRTVPPLMLIDTLTPGNTHAAARYLSHWPSAWLQLAHVSLPL